MKPLPLPPMIAIENTLVSEDLLDKHFVCDLAACKGECCIAGDAGAPLLMEELEILEQIYPSVKPYIPAEGIKTLEEKGLYEVDEDDGEYVTPLVDGNHCAFTRFEDGIAKCSIEKAYYEGKTTFKKPISCHLYPVRIKQYKDHDAVNYEKWDVCKPACACGEKLKVPVFRFVKEALERKYGKEWYKQLELVAEQRNK